MKERLLAAAAALLCVAAFLLPASAQTNPYTTVTATQLKMNGALIGHGSVTFTPIDAGGHAVSLSSADGALQAGATLPSGFTASIVNGVITTTGFEVPDMRTASAVTANTPWSYKVQIDNTDTRQSATFLIPATNPVVSGSSAFALDHYAAQQTISLSPTGLITGAVAPAHCSTPSIFYPQTAPYRTSKCVAGVFVQDSASGGSSITWQGAWSSSTTYSAYDVASYGGSSYISLQTANLGNNPSTATAWWGLLASAGAAGSNGTNGVTPTFSIGNVTTGAANSQATVTITGTAPAYVLNLTLPQGVAGSNGATPAFNIGTVTTGAANSQASATLTGTAPNYVLNLTLPQGVAGTAGTNGTTPTFSIGTVTTGTAAATLTGTAPAYVLNLTIPQGAAGTNGTNGASIAPPTGYAAGTTYAQYALVSYGGNVWQSQQSANTGNTPTAANSSWWLPFAHMACSGTAPAGAGYYCDPFTGAWAAVPAAVNLAAPGALCATTACTLNASSITASTLAVTGSGSASSSPVYINGTPATGSNPRPLVFINAGNNTVPSGYSANGTAVGILVPSGTSYYTMFEIRQAGSTTPFFNVDGNGYFQIYTHLNTDSVVGRTAYGNTMTFSTTNGGTTVFNTPIQATNVIASGLTGTGSAVACLNASGQLTRSTNGTTCP